jgi:NAD(P)-dependent dehydrogenase (short-subunit alcohol dehydrogenase family)
MAPLDGYHALVTGGGSGIGAAIARALAGAGAAVSIAGRRRGPLDEVAASLKRGKGIVADVTSEADCRSMVAAARAAHGPLDIVIANAGGAISAPVEKVDLAHWRQMIDLNLTGAFMTVSAALPDLTRGRTTPSSLRRIVFVASTAGLKGYAYVAAYCAAKHGVVGLARALAVELAPRGVTVNAVCPGYTETPMLAAAVANIASKTGRAPEQVRADLAKANSDGRLVTPEEVAAMVLWLCSPAGQGTTGEAIPIPRGEA